MLSASQEFRDKLIKGSPVYSKARITLLDGTIINLDCKDFLYGTSGFRISTATSNDNSFDIGACIVGQLDLKILNYSGQFNIYSFDKARVEVWVYMSLSGDSIEANKFISPSADIIDAGDVADMEDVTQIYDGGVFENKHIESIKKGVFYVDSQNFNGGVVSLTCYDKLMVFNADYTGSSVTMPASQWINELANRHGLSVKNSRFNNSTLELTLPTDKTYTDLQLLNYILQCTGNYAKIDEDELLEISWYDVGKINSYNAIDAGDFNNPSVDIVDAGNVADMEDVATIYSGGTFEERKDDKYTIHIFNNPTVDIDDVVVTGVRTILDDDTSVLAGSEGYVLKVEKNPFINSDNQQDITERLWEVCQGLTFRPMSITTLNDPLIQTGDIMQVQIKGNAYTSLVTSISYTQGGHTQIKCSAESPTKNSTKIGSKPLGVDKKVNGIVDKRLTAYDIGIQMLTNLITQSMGLYETAEVQEDGSTIYIMHDKPNLSDSMKLWKMTADGFVVSNDGGVTWNSGWDVNGNAVMNILSVIGINFDWAKGGTLTLGGENNVNGRLSIKNALNQTIGTWDVDGINAEQGNIGGWYILSDGGLSSDPIYLNGKCYKSWMNTPHSAVDNTWIFSTQVGTNALNLYGSWRVNIHGQMAFLYSDEIGVKGGIVRSIPILDKEGLDAKAVAEIYWDSSISKLVITKPIDSLDVGKLDVGHIEVDSIWVKTEWSDGQGLRCYGAFFDTEPGDRVVICGNGGWYGGYELLIMGKERNMYVGGDIVVDGQIKGTISTDSDRNIKHDISQLDKDKASSFIYSLNPCQFKYNTGTSDRFHHGLIAQEVREAMGDDDWGLYVDKSIKNDNWEKKLYNSKGEHVSTDETAKLSLVYQELIADLIATVQSQNERLKVLEEEIAKLKEGK